MRDSALLDYSVVALVVRGENDQSRSGIRLCKMSAAKKKKDKLEKSVGILLKDVYAKVKNRNSTNIHEMIYFLDVQVLRPLEEKYLFPTLQAPFMEDADFTANPQVLLIGQYSTGKN